MTKALNKAVWTTRDNEVRLGMEISKVDTKGRMVYGWATIDNEDTAGDIVTIEASRDAFQRSRGNLREMHKKDSAVGRVVSFKEKSFRAPDGQIHNGIFVKVRVSKGAEDTWQKVLDGTLNGFSIGGEIVESETLFAKDGRQRGEKVTKYNLNELSLVDNPGNQYSDFTNIFKMRQSADGSVTALTGMVEDTMLLNVFYCEEDGISVESANDSETCPICEASMKEIGFVEHTGDLDGKVKSLVTKYVGGGGETMAKKNEEETTTTDESVETGHEAGDVTEVPTPAEPAEGVGEAVEVEEVEDESHEISKKIDNLKDDIQEIVKRAGQAQEEKIATLEKAIADATAEFNKTASDLNDRIVQIDKNVGIAKARAAELEQQLEKMNSSTAFSKSVGAETRRTEPEQKNDPWAGTAFSVYDLLGR